MRVLVVGSGGREHALCWKIAQSPLVDKLYAAPGNPGTESVPKTENVLTDIVDAGDIFALQRFASAEHVDITVVGSENLIALGIADFFEECGLSIFAPKMDAAQIETSKAFAHRFCRRHGISMPSSGIFHLESHALQHVARHWLENGEEAPPLVLKADGLAQGKGTFICHNLNEAREALKTLMRDKKFGRAGERVILQKYLSGREVSFHACTDGITSIPLMCSHDYKALFAANPEEGKHAGPNTGGMGAYAPVPWIDCQKELELHEAFSESILDGLRREGMSFHGCLYPGVMIQENGEPELLECNARMGDPEAQVILAQMESDLAELLFFYKEGRLDKACLQWKPGYSVCIVLASAGYPGELQNLETPIFGVEDAEKTPGVVICHAGTKRKGDQLVTAGGRVLTIVASAETMAAAVSKAYEAIGHIFFQGMYFRHDIGHSS